MSTVKGTPIHMMATGCTEEVVEVGGCFRPVSSSPATGSVPEW